MTSRRQFIFGVICFALSHKATAITNASCKICKRWFIYSCEGAGYARDKLNVTCGRCSFRDQFNDRFGPEDPLVDFMLNMAAQVKEALMEANYQGDRYDVLAKLTRVAHLGSKFYGLIDESGMRYITFDDGTELDLAHVVSAAPIAAMGYDGEIPILDFFEHTLLQAGANVAGFMYELGQFKDHPHSAHPFGGNEDLRSNWVGSQIGANGILQNGHGDVGTQLTDYFESLGHGQIRGHQGQNPVDGLGGCG